MRYFRQFFFSYAIKETSIVLLPVIFITIGIRALPALGGSKIFIRYFFRHIGLHLVFFIFVISFTQIYKNGAYVSNYGFIGENLLKNYNLSIRSLSLGVPVLKFTFVCISILDICCFKEGIQIKTALTQKSGMIYFTICGIGLYIGFWLINLPWAPLIAKYFLPALFFISMTAVLIQAGVYNTLAKNGFRIMAVLWFMASTVYIVIEAGKSYHRVDNNYRSVYRYRASIPLIAEKIAERKMNQLNHKIWIIPGERLFQEGVLPFQRYLNLIYGLNTDFRGAITVI